MIYMIYTSGKKIFVNQRNIQLTPYTTYNIEHTTYITKHTLYNTQRATHNRHHTTHNIHHLINILLPRIQCDVLATIFALFLGHYMRIKVGHLYISNYHKRLRMVKSDSELAFFSRNSTAFPFKINHVEKLKSNGLRSKTFTLS